MAIYHFSAKVISRAAGSSALASAAYRSASRLHDDRLDRHHDFSNKSGVVHSEVMLPDGAPEHLSDREKLWNEVEAAEKRIDAQLAREIEFAIPREMNQEQGVELARDFVQREFVDRGMIADLNVHWDIGADGLAKPHAHVMLTMREVGEDGFGKKNRDWNRTDLLEKWRERWSDHVNQRLAELDIDARIDHRSLEAQGIDLEPQHKIGPAASRMAADGLESERLEEHRAIARANGEKLLANPALALNAITHQQATFTTRDLAMFVHRHSDGKDQFDRVMAAVKASPELVALGKDGRSEQRFTSRDMIETEARLERAAERLAGRDGHGLPAAMQRGLNSAAGSDGLRLGREQQAALAHITRPSDLAIVTGYAGTGKSATLGIARDEWERAGYHVQGLALSGIAAENLESGSGIASRTIASIEHQWGQGRELLDQSSILVIDEAGMIGTRQLERVLSEAEKRGAKVVLVGDPEQLQAIEAGAAFRSTAERHGCVEITEIRRQHEDWQRDATRQLATGRTAEAIAAYEESGRVHVADTREGARGELIDRWERDRASAPNRTRIILTHTNDEVLALNLAARERLGCAGQLGDDVIVQTERGERAFASGARIMFLKNERSLGVKNGTLGTIETVSSVRMAVQLDDGRSIAFDIKDYNQIDHGYAATIHKAQGMTVDRAHVLATPGMDRHAAYVALSRHRDGVDLHYGKDDFADQGRLVRTLSRERSKDVASDYARAPQPAVQTNRAPVPARDFNAPIVDIAVPVRPAEAAPPRRSMFDGLTLNADPIDKPQRSPLDRAVERYARAAQDITRMRDMGYEPLAHQRQAMAEAGKAVDALQRNGARDLGTAMTRDPALVGEAANGRTAKAIQAMVAENEMRIDATNRADRFVKDWQVHTRQFRRLERNGDYLAAEGVKDKLDLMAKSLHRDAQLESLLRNRVSELGIRGRAGASLSHELQQSLSLSRSRGMGL
ncbi:MAG: Ti-type conjugative transfer relaxase TraA [Sphingomonas sp.]|uniref:Ti-type conjugative transfer relaxase TraA n=1 Tax=Sphingomonas sp. TaxID=28214 RepID=UPI003F7EF5A9